MALKCPRDQASLVPHSIQGVELHVCEECGGIFVGVNQGGVAKHSFKELRPGRRSRIPVAEEAKLLSPETGRPMIVFCYRGVEIDYCPDSNSVWLDRGEWEKIADFGSGLRKGLHRDKSVFSKNSGSTSGGQSFWSGIDAAFSSVDALEFIGDSISNLFDL